jgi:hypothetical protein
MRKHQNSRTPYDTVTIDTFRVDKRDGIVAIAVDSATNLKSGIGIDQDPQSAIEKSIQDAIRPKVWSPACGIPRMLHLNHSLDGSTVAPLAQGLGIIILRGPLQRIERSLVALTRTLNMMPPVERFRDQQLYCDIVQSARIDNKSVRHALGKTPEDAWLSASRRYGVRLPSPALVAGGPHMIRAKMDAGGFVEIEGRIYADKRIPIIANWETDEVDVIVFPDDTTKIWICELNKRAFPAFRRSIEPIGPSVRTKRQIRTPIDVDESWPLKGVPTYFDWGDDSPKRSRSTLHSQHPLWVHRLMDEVIENVWLSPSCPSASHVFHLFQDRLRRRAEELGWAVPAVNTSCFYRKIRRIDPYLVARSRHGLAAARRRFRSHRSR